MSTTRGCKGVVKAGPTPTVVAEITAWDFTETADEIDTSSMGTCTKKSDAGAVKTAGNITCFWDASDAGQNLLIVGEKVYVELYPGGDTNGLTYYKGKVLILSRGISSTVNEIVSQPFTFSVNGKMTEDVAA